MDEFKVFFIVFGWFSLAIALIWWSTEFVK